MIEQEGDGGCRSSMLLLPTPSLFFFSAGSHPAYVHDLEADPRREAAEISRRFHGDAPCAIVRQGRLNWFPRGEGARRPFYSSLVPDNQKVMLQRKSKILKGEKFVRVGHVGIKLSSWFVCWGACSFKLRAGASRTFVCAGGV